ncbi:hypothetical protein BVX97_01800 [bacterium E08(2017)]|nr:hypothetical protein BVX97_01800 [bacterium E08(2017)]
MRMVRFVLLLGMAVMLASCSHMNLGGAGGEVLFEDSMAESWETNWFLDGKKAVLEHRDGGLAYITEYTVNKNVDRAGFDSQHAILWTKQEFEGDIRITYNFTKLPGSSWQKLIYIQAQGIGEDMFVEDIHAWRDFREVATMSKYFTYMDLISLSLRGEIRCKRYPTTDMEGNRIPCEFKPRGENRGLEAGRDFYCVVEKRKKTVYLRIKDVETGEIPVEHTWDLRELTKGRDPKYVTKGRIGLRHMGGYGAFYRNFKVESL